MPYIVEGDFVFVKSTGQRGQVIWITGDGYYKVETGKEEAVQVLTYSRDNIAPLY